jgi:uncharacterized protein YqjF (DUF2071 family)
MARMNLSWRTFSLTEVGRGHLLTVCLFMTTFYYDVVRKQTTKKISYARLIRSFGKLRRCHVSTRGRRGSAFASLDYTRNARRFRVRPFFGLSRSRVRVFGFRPYVGVSLLFV